MHQAFDTRVYKAPLLPYVFCAHGEISGRGGRGPAMLGAPVRGGGGDLGSQGEMGGKGEQAEKESEEWERRRQLSRGRGQEQGVRGSEA